MAINLDRVIRAAAQAALEESDAVAKSGKGHSSGGRHRGLSAPQTFLIGAGLVTAVRLAVAARGRNVLESLQERLVEYEHRHFDSEPEDDVLDEDVLDEYDDEPEDEYDEDEDEDAEPAERSEGGGARR